MVDPGRLWLIGAGNMGGALLARWRLAGCDPIVVDPALGLALPAEGTPDIVVLAVKPQVWRAAAVPLVGRVGAAVVVSVMAGIALADLAVAFPAATVVRAMPNTPARLGRGVTGLFAATADPAIHVTVDTLFAVAGATVWLDRESDFDVLTAVSGSGPAYLFAFIEALAAAGTAAGLAPDLAMRLSVATVTGAAALADEGTSAADLRVAVTSPHGTTAAGLAVLQPGLGALLRKTVAAAQSRSRALGQGA